MLKYRITYIFILAISVVFAAVYESKLTLVLMISLFTLPVISFILLAVSRIALKPELSRDEVFTSKQRNFNVTVKLKNRFILPVAPVKLTVDFQDEEGNLVRDKMISASVMPFSCSEFLFGGFLKYRGEYMLGITGLRIYDFLGIFSLSYKKLPVCRVTVAPRRLVLSENGALCDEETDSLRTQYTFFENDTFTSVREYADGDSLRRVHWKLSAKQDKLMVKQSDLNLSSSAAIIIDTSSDYPDDIQAQREVDALLEAALAVSRKIISEGSTAACIYHDSEEKVELIAAQTADDFEYLYHKFSIIPVLNTESGLSVLISLGTEIIRDSGLVFIFASRIKTEVFRNALSAGLAPCTGIRIFLTCENADKELAEFINTDNRIRVTYIDPENIAATLEAALFP